MASVDAERLAYAFTKLIPEWAGENLHEAAAWAARISDAEMRSEVLRIVAQLWAAKNPGEALKWAESLPSEADREAMFMDVALYVASSDPAEAVKMRAHYVPEGSFNSALENLTQRWAEQDFSAAWQWTLQRPAVGARDALIERLVFVRAQTDPPAAIALGLEYIANLEVRDEALIAIVHQWARKDWSGAGSWVAEMEGGSLRDRAIAELSATRAAATGL